MGNARNTGTCPAPDSGPTLQIPARVSDGYSDLLEVVRQDLNEILAMTDEQIDRLVGDVLREAQTSEAVQARQLQQERAAAV